MAPFLTPTLVLVSLVLDFENFQTHTSLENQNLSLDYLYNKIPYSTEDELDFYLSTQANLQKAGE